MEKQQESKNLPVVKKVLEPVTYKGGEWRNKVKVQKEEKVLKLKLISNYDVKEKKKMLGFPGWKK